MGITDGRMNQGLPLTPSITNYFRQRVEERDTEELKEQVRGLHHIPSELFLLEGWWKTEERSERSG